MYRFCLTIHSGNSLRECRGPIYRARRTWMVKALQAK